MLHSGASQRGVGLVLPSAKWLRDFASAGDGRVSAPAERALAALMQVCAGLPLPVVEVPRGVLMLAGCECPLDLQNEQSAAREAMQSGRSCALVLWDIAACDVMQRNGDVVSL